MVEGLIWLTSRVYRRPKKNYPGAGMVSAPSCELKTGTPATRSAWACGHFSTQTVRRASLLGVAGMLENSLLMPPNCRRVANPNA
jgi:hypothetical protein